MLPTAPEGEYGDRRRCGYDLSAAGAAGVRVHSRSRNSGRRTSARFFAGLLTGVLVRRTLKDADDTPAEFRPQNGDYLPAGRPRSARLVDTEPYDAALKEIYDAVREGEEPDVVICGWLASTVRSAPGSC